MKTSTFTLNGFTFKARLRQAPDGGFYCTLRTPAGPGQLLTETWPSAEEAWIDAGEIALDWSKMLAGLLAEGAAL